MRAVLIVNPHATSTTERRRDLLTHAFAGELDLQVVHTTGRGHAADIAAAAAADGVGLVLVHGGDGTVNETVNGLLAAGVRPDNPMLSVIPGGSTNVFARAVGVPADPTDAVEHLLGSLERHQPPRSVSLGRAGQRYFTFNAGMGIDAEVVRRVEQHRALGKPISNSLHVRQALAAYRDRNSDRTGPLTLTLPGTEPVSGCRLAFVSNVSPWTYLHGRAIRTNPDTSPDHGLGVFAATSLSVPTVLRTITQLARSKPGRGPHGASLIRADDVGWVRLHVTEFTGRGVGVQADGDYLGEFTEVEFVSVPHALRVLV